MIRLCFATDQNDDQIRRVTAFLATADEKQYMLDGLEEVGLYENESELANLRDFVSYWTTQAEMLRLPISIDKEVEQYGIELAMEMEL